MFEVRRLEEFAAWLRDLTDKRVRNAILARIDRLELGLKGDAKPVGEGIWEMRIHLGAGWRIYFIQQGARLIMLLAGGSKATQSKDIKRAKQLAAGMEYRKDRS